MELLGKRFGSIAPKHLLVVLMIWGRSFIIFNDFFFINRYTLLKIMAETRNFVRKMNLNLSHREIQLGASTGRRII